MNICFIINDWEEFDPETDSSLRIIHEAVRREHVVGILYAKNLTVRNNVVCGFVNIIDCKQPVNENVSIFHKRMKFKSHLLPLRGFDTIFLSKNPPLDWLMVNFLDSLKKDVFIVNDIDGIRKANNKLYTTTFEDSNQFIPETHVSKNIKYLVDTIKESDKSKWILKPLVGFGGQGVIVLEKKAMQNIRSLLEFYIDGGDRKNYVILQEYVDGAEEGDVRVLLLGGEPIGAMRRVPGEDDPRSNIKAGGKAIKHTLSKQEILLCKHIGPKLVSDGIYFAGLDLIKGKLLEVNVLSPGGITRINRFNRCKLQRKVLDYIEGHFRKVDISTKQKAEFRNLVMNA
ncbi:MAG: glutathione synthase [Chlamydiales bacterium]|jgi:glutathione synthase